MLNTYTVVIRSLDYTGGWWWSVTTINPGSFSPEAQRFTTPQLLGLLSRLPSRYSVRVKAD